MSRASLIIYGVPVTIILILSAIVIFRKNQLNDLTDKEKALRDSISVLSVQIDSSHAKQARLQLKIDSLTSIETTVITRTHDKIKFIYSIATPHELDSIIRTNWKTKPRQY